LKRFKVVLQAVSKPSFALDSIINAIDEELQYITPLDHIYDMAYEVNDLKRDVTSSFVTLYTPWGKQ
jgi:hypothetical protein